MVCHHPALTFVPELKSGAAASVLEDWPRPFPMPEEALDSRDRAIPAWQIWTPRFWEETMNDLPPRPAAHSRICSVAITTYITRAAEPKILDQLVDCIRRFHPWEHPIIEATECLLYVPR
jgi:hypothetical protein